MSKLPEAWMAVNCSVCTGRYMPIVAPDGECPYCRLGKAAGIDAEELRPMVMAATVEIHNLEWPEIITT